MALYRKKPLEVELIQFKGSNFDEIFDAFGREPFQVRTTGEEEYLEVRTTHGDIAYIRTGDWVAPDSNPGTFYPIKNDVFEITYELTLPRMDGDYEVLGPELFTNGDVISYKGENYYRACDERVATLEEGSQSHCVKRVKHPSRIHEDYYGRIRVG